MALALRGKIEIEDQGYKVGDAVKVTVFFIHPMENGLMKDKVNDTIKPADFVKDIKVTFNDEEIFSLAVGASTSANPKFMFPLKVSGKGVLKAVFTDNKGNKAEKTTEVVPS